MSNVYDDKQYGLSAAELDKYRRRQEIKDRLKLEGIKKRFDPYGHMKGDLLTDPAIERFVDARRKGRMPGTPWKPSLFFSIVGIMFIPPLLYAMYLTSERNDYLGKIETGEISYKERKAKHDI